MLSGRVDETLTDRVGGACSHGCGDVHGHTVEGDDYRELIKGKRGKRFLA
jgi:hypothetical protein